QFLQREIDRQRQVELRRQLLERAVTHLHRIRAPRYLDDRRERRLGIRRRSGCWRRCEMPRKRVHVDGGRRDDDLEIRPSRQQLLEITEQKIDVETALVRLVDDQRVVAIEKTILLDLGQ